MEHRKIKCGAIKSLISITSILKIIVKIVKTKQVHG